MEATLASGVISASLISVIKSPGIAVNIRWTGGLGRVNSTQLISENMETVMPGLKELLAQREALQHELEQARQQEADRALREIVAKMREYKISLQELIGTRANARLVAPVANAKYRDPATGATWSGRGRAPQWIADKNRDDFLIQPSLFRSQ
jgi:DNA-binding protein H-NS